MEIYFARNYPGDPFVLFGIAHLTALSLVVLLNVWLFRQRRQFSDLGRQRVRYSLAAALVINELLWHTWNATTGQWSLQTMLPFHLCSALVWLSAYTLITKQEQFYDFIYFLGLAGATQALLTPDAGPYGFPHFRFFQIFISHGAIVTTGLYLVFVEAHRPTLQSLLRVFLGTGLYAVLVGGINAVLGSNYLYLARKPETASLIDVMPPWPGYIPILVGLAAVVLGLLYLPFWRRQPADRPLG